MDWSNRDTELFSHISIQRQRKTEKYFHVSDRKLSMYAELTTRMGISILSGIAASELMFHAADNHKPYILNCTDYHFSISHSGQVVMCCISDEEVGADVERIGYTPYEVMRLVFHAEEIQYIDNSCEKSKDVRFFEMWTRKTNYKKSIVKRKNIYE